MDKYEAISPPDHCIALLFIHYSTKVIKQNEHPCIKFMWAFLDLRASTSIGVGYVDWRWLILSSNIRPGGSAVISVSYFLKTY